MVVSELCFLGPAFLALLPCSVSASHLFLTTLHVMVSPGVSEQRLTSWFHWVLKFQPQKWHISPDYKKTMEIKLITSLFSSVHFFLSKSYFFSLSSLFLLLSDYLNSKSTVSMHLVLVLKSPQSHGWSIDFSFHVCFYWLTSRAEKITCVADTTSTHWSFLSFISVLRKLELNILFFLQWVSDE